MDETKTDWVKIPQIVIVCSHPDALRYFSYSSSKDTCLLKRLYTITISYKKMPSRATGPNSTVSFMTEPWGMPQETCNSSTYSKCRMFVIAIRQSPDDTWSLCKSDVCLKLGVLLCFMIRILLSTTRGAHAQNMNRQTNECICVCVCVWPHHHSCSPGCRRSVRRQQALEPLVMSLPLPAWVCREGFWAWSSDCRVCRY